MGPSLPTEMTVTAGLWPLAERVEAEDDEEDEEAAPWLVATEFVSVIDTLPVVTLEETADTGPAASSPLSTS